MKRAQKALRDALEAAAPDSPTTQLALIYVYARRIDGVTEKDVAKVREQILGGPVRECSG